ncbi:MAG: carbamate kinase [Phycisphaerae bacterium]|nr:carbamate kinase [Phycisphaerae bacterium]
MTGATKGQRIVVALGGNAISLPDEEGRVDQQFFHSREAAAHLVSLAEQGHQLVITHGNGPQIGNFLLRNEAAAGKIYALPMEVAVAHVQGGMGFMIAQVLTNELAKRKIDRVVNAVVTTVLVHEDDSSFQNPTKPIGRILSREEAGHFAQNDGWTMKEVSPGKFRRVVPSPRPQHIMEIELIREAVASGQILIACGGGGIPVVRDGHGDLRGVRAIIDKDLASALLANEVDADAMMILTNVERVCLDFGKPTQRDISEMTLDQARRWLAEGQFPAGSMGPKVQASVVFLEHSRKRDAHVFIGSLEKASNVIRGVSGTRISKS